MFSGTLNSTHSLSDSLTHSFTNVFSILFLRFVTHITLSGWWLWRHAENPRCLMSNKECFKRLVENWDSIIRLVVSWLVTRQLPRDVHWCNQETAVILRHNWTTTENKCCCNLNSLLAACIIVDTHKARRVVYMRLNGEARTLRLYWSRGIAGLCSSPFNLNNCNAAHLAVDGELCLVDITLLLRARFSRCSLRDQWRSVLVFRRAGPSYHCRTPSQSQQPV